MTLSPIERTDGRPYLLAVIRDVTERKRAEEAIRALNADLLKTPTTSLLLNAQYLLRTLRQNHALTSEQLESRLLRIESQAHKHAQLVQQLLDISYIARGRLRLEKQDTNLTALVAGVVERCRESRPEGRIAYRAPTSIIARVDPLRMEQAVTNLLDNALVYGESDEPIEVDVCQSSPKRVIIRVRDYGPGVASEDRDHLFGRFFRGRRHEHTAGLGLGLYITKQIIQAHGGAIAVDFPADGGTQFTIELATGQPRSVRPGAETEDKRPTA